MASEISRRLRSSRGDHDMRRHFLTDWPFPLPAERAKLRMWNDREATEEQLQVIARVKSMTAIAERATTHDGERENALSLAWKLCMKHGLVPEEWGLILPLSGEERNTALHYMDLGYELWSEETRGWAASTLFESMSSLLATVPWHRGDPPDFSSRNERMAHYAERRMLLRARRRWREGYWANPFTKHPIARPNFEREKRTADAPTVFDDRGEG